MISVRGWLGTAALVPAGLLAMGCGGSVDLDGKRGHSGGSSQVGGAGSARGGGQGSAGASGAGGTSTAPPEMTGGAPPEQACGAGVGAPSVPQVDAAQSSRYNWSECGRIEPGRRSLQALYASDGSILSLEAGGRVRAYVPGAVSGSTLVDAPNNPGAWVGGLRLANHGTRLLVWDDSTAQVYEAKDQTPIGPTSGALSQLASVTPAAAGCADSLTLSSDGTLLVAKGEQKACAWQVSTGGLVLNVTLDVVSNHTATAVGVTADGSALRVLRNGVLFAFAPSGAQTSRVDLPLAANVYNDDAAFSEDAETLLLIDGLAKPQPQPQLVALDASTGRERWRHDLVLDPNPQLAVTGEGSVVIPGNAVYRIADGEKLAHDPDGYTLRNSVSLSPKGLNEVRTFYQVEEWDLSQQKLLRLYGAHSRVMLALDISRDGRYLASHDQDDAIVWQLNTKDFGQSVPLYNGKGSDSSWNVALAPDGSSMVVSGDNVSSFQRDGAFQGPVTPPAAAIRWLSPDWGYSPNGCLAAGMHYNTFIEVHDARDMSFLRTLMTPAGNAGVAFSPDSSRLMTANLDLFDTRDWSLLWSKQPSDPSSLSFLAENAVDYAPDGNAVVITRCTDHGPDSCLSARYDARTGAPIGGTLPELTGDRARYSPEGHWLVSKNRALNLNTGRLLEYANDAKVALFTPEGDIIAGESDGSLVRYCRITEP